MRPHRPSRGHTPGSPPTHSSPKTRGIAVDADAPTSGQPSAFWPQYSPMPISDEGFQVPRTPSLPALDTMFPVMRNSPLRSTGPRVGTAGSRSFGVSGRLGTAGSRISTARSRMSHTAPAGRRTPQGVEVPATTQLVERFPQVDVPQRVEPPPWINAPRRVPTKSQDDRAAKSFDATQASNNKKSKLNKYDIRSYGPQTDSPPPKKESAPGPKRDNAVRKKLKDRAMLAFACRRADRGNMEAAAYFCMGVLHDNLEEFDPAIKAYQNFLAVCRRTGDRIGEALAYNAIAVDFHLRGQRTANPKNYKMAVHYHTKHLSVADEQGQFVAHTNLGLAYSALSRNDAAARAHQDALRIAIRLGSAFGQSIAVGNLGMVASRQRDLATAKACLDQHLTLVQGMKDKNAESHACQQLGALANASGDFAGATKYFEQARRVAQMAGARGLSKTAACKLGVAEGNMRLQQYMDTKARAVTATRAASRKAAAGPVVSIAGWSPSRASGGAGGGAGAGAGAGAAAVGTHAGFGSSAYAL